MSHRPAVHLERVSTTVIAAVPHTVHPPEQRVFLRLQVKHAELMRRLFAYGPSWFVTKRMGFGWGADGGAAAVEGAP